MRYWFITGSSKGLGKALTEFLLRDSAHFVYGIARTNTHTHSNFQFIETDLADTEKLEQFRFPDLLDPQTAFPESITLINNAAVLGDIQYMGDLDASEIIRAYNINTIAPHVLMNAFINKYKDSNRVPKTILNITSGAASTPYDGWSLYGSGKAALDMMTQIAAKEMELRKQHFKIVAIAPGVMDTDMQAQIRATEKNNFSRREKFDAFYLEKKLVSPEIAAGKLVDLVLNPYLLTETVSRL